MAIDLLSVEAFQVLKTAALVAAFFINRQALIILAFTLSGEWLFSTFSHNPVLYFCLAACLYSINAAINIRILSNIRNALICIACLNWLSALDFILTETETLFYLCYPWLINGLDVFILYCLMWKGGRQSVGVVRPWNCRLANL